MLGFAVVLAISAVSMGIAYLGFERVSAGVSSYRNSVSEADLARNIDRELISYRGLARYFVVTGKEDDGKAALAAEASLKDAIDKAMKGTTNPARLDQVTRLGREFQTFTRIFADILKLKRESALMVQNQLTRGGSMLRYKLDDLASNAADAELPAVELGAKQVQSQYQAATALANNFVINSDPAVATSALARLKFVENSLHAISATDEKIVQTIKEAFGLLADYRQALTKLIENAKSIDELTTEMADLRGRDHAGLDRDEGGPALRSAAAGSGIRCDHRRDRAPDRDARGRRLPARRRAGAAAGQGNFAADDRDVQGDARTRRRQFRRRAARPRPQGRIGEMAGAVEEFKVQAVAKAERDAAAQDAQNKASSAARRSRTDPLCR